MPSVFTHLLEEDTVNYLRQVHRVLKPGGMALLNFFIADSMSTPLLAMPGATVIGVLEPVKKGVMWGAKGNHEGAIVFEEAWLRSVVLQIGFEIGSVSKGAWTNQGARLTGLHDGQDKLFVIKPDHKH
jgi:hypothetical protein